MFISYEIFSERAEALRVRIAEACRACGRAPAEVSVLPVTKTHPPIAAEYARRFGWKAVGENRVQEGIEKRPLAPADLRWELIGHLQSNKAKFAVAHFDRIQSVDSEKLLLRLNQAAQELGVRRNLLLQINAGRDPAKFGAELEDAPRLLETALAQPHLAVDGLMTIAPLSDDPDVARRTFAALRTLRDELRSRFGVPLPELSMGMTGDLDIAISAGSTLVRVGTFLYGAR